MTETATLTLPLRIAALSAKKPVRFDLVPGEADLAQLAADLGLASLRRLRFKGDLRPSGKRDWLLEATLGATVVQPCVATLAPVTTRIEERVTRRYLADMTMPEAEETEMPEDDSAEPLPEVVDPGAVMAEALALALPLYPRAEGAAPAEVEAAPPGAAPIGEDHRRPFAGLAELLGRRDSGPGGDGDGGGNA